MLKTVVLLNIFVEIIIIFCRIEKKYQKNSIYLKLKSFVAFISLLSLLIK